MWERLLRLMQAQHRRLMQAPARLGQARLLPRQGQARSVQEAEPREAKPLESREVEARPLLRLIQAQRRRLMQAPAHLKQARLSSHLKQTWSLPRQNQSWSLQKA